MKSALLLAVEQNSLDIVKLLLEAGADVNQLAKMLYQVGMKIEGDFRGRGKWFRARIKAIYPDNKFDIDYDDGEQELQVSVERIRTMGESKFIHIFLRFVLIAVIIIVRIIE